MATVASRAAQAEWLANQPAIDPDAPDTAPPASLTHTQGPDAAVWTILHNLGRFPTVSVTDTARQQISGVVTHAVDANSTTITFSHPVSGRARLT